MSNISKKIKLYESKKRFARIGALHTRFQPHEGQVTCGKNIFSWNKKFLFAQCGRSWGKSYFGTYAAVRVAVTHPNAKVYVVLPERQQAQEIIWESGYLRQMLPTSFLKGQSEEKAFNKSDLRVTLDNGSFIKLMGSDNPDRLRGIKPHFVVFDEFRDFKSDAFDIMEPNLGVNDATLLILSTPPDVEGFYTALREYFISEMDSGNRQYFYLELPTSTNPHYPTERLEATKRMLIARGEYSVWLREYEAKFIPGGTNAVFRKFNDNKKGIVRPSHMLQELVRRHQHRVQWFCIADPAQNSVFGVLYGCVNKNSGQIFIFDEEYERDNSNTGAVNMWHRMADGMNAIYPYPERWTTVYDEAEAWFYNDIWRSGYATVEHTIQPTQKRSRDKKEDMSILKDLFSTKGRIFISDRCTHLISEIQNYVTDDKGQYKKENDHLIDCLRYLIAAADYEPLEYPTHAQAYPNYEAPRGESFPQAFKRVRAELGYTDDEESGAELVYWDDLNIDTEGFYH